MPTAPDNHDAYDYAERIRERLPSRLQELREAMGLINAPQPHESSLRQLREIKLAAAQVEHVLLLSEVLGEG